MIYFDWKQIRIEFHFLFLGVIALFLLMDRTGVAACGLTASILHETGHLIAFACSGYRPKRLSFELTGICLEKGNQNISYAKEIIILFAGSGMNFLLFAANVGWAVMNQRGADGIGIFGVTNLVLGLINLLPVSALDGGKILHICLQQFCSPRVSAKICFWIQLMITLLLTLSAVISVLLGNTNFTVLLFCAYLVAMLLLSGQ